MSSIHSITNSLNKVFFWKIVRIIVNALNIFIQYYEAHVNDMCTYWVPQQQQKQQFSIFFNAHEFNYWVLQRLPQICTVIVYICIGKVA